MKKLLMFAAISAVTLVACKKDDDNDNNQTNEQLILGTWTSVLVEGSTYDNTNADTVIIFSFPGPIYTFTFESNGTFKSQVFGDTSTYTGTYTLSGNTLVTIADGDTVGGEITTLTSNKLIFEDTDTYTEDSISYTDKSYIEFAK